MRIVIAGQAKSGTTALFHVLKQSCPRDYKQLFEPTSYRGPGDKRVIAKVLINPNVELADFDHFDRKILIIRDPRDNLVSRLLYAPYDKDFIKDDVRLARFVALLKRKELRPAQVTLLELFDLLNELSGTNVLENILLNQKAALAFEDARPGYYRYRYENLVVRAFSGLERYLGFALRFNGKVDPEYNRVARTLAAGDWRNWFTPPDMQFLRNELHPYLARFGYDETWITAGEPRIAPEHASNYVKRIAREKRALLGIA